MHAARIVRFHIRMIDGRVRSKNLRNYLIYIDHRPNCSLNTYIRYTCALYGLIGITDQFGRNLKRHSMNTLELNRRIEAVLATFEHQSVTAFLLALARKTGGIPCRMSDGTVGVIGIAPRAMIVTGVMQ